MIRLLVLAVMLGASGCIGDVESHCQVGGALAGGSYCNFTNKGTFPATMCLKVLIKKTSGAPNAGPPGDDYAPAGAAIGSVASSPVICSGTVWGSSTIKVDVPSLDPDPHEMCGNWDNCTLQVVPES